MLQHTEGEKCDSVIGQIWNGMMAPCSFLMEKS